MKEPSKRGHLPPAINDGNAQLRKKKFVFRKIFTAIKNDIKKTTKNQNQIKEKQNKEKKTL